ncbi:GNAT superfamily N-acetyltransferase [Saccharomonospora amisosensis]|uniref:GNAT superfamily N-acetyltransferase n=1 Tax=Saccharomonospora amisosensis TaxID=1128677 RepID=A0A7X5ZS44_9PSEU|nr:GNAT family N-acetyltransferase [Saccharomonospora amisosensis]NIJ13166.1 GNAT superfamily N-acetyltransferase [Saccharomonospora amisosensis]
MSSGSEPTLAAGLQERAARALPAEHVERLGGWWLRHAPGCAWWVGTVLPHGIADGPGELAARVTEVERYYADRGAQARFQITARAAPEGLDELLAERGYRRHGLMSLRAARTCRVLERAESGSPCLRLEERPTRAWFETWHAVSGTDPDPRGEWELLRRALALSAYACVLAGGEVVAVGRAVVDTGWAGVFGMATRARARGRGAARGVLAALARWAEANGADHMYLQVERDNAAAVRLYEGMGFGEVSGYHYRVAT